LEKVGKLFAKLSSQDEDAESAAWREEAATAAAMMNDILRKVGLTLHDLWQLGWNEKKEDIAELFAALSENDADVLVKIGQQRASYFLNDAVFADVVVNGHRNTYAVESKTFAKWLLHEFFQDKKRVPQGSAIKSAIRTLAAVAEFRAATPRHRIHLRTACPRRGVRQLKMNTSGKRLPLPSKAPAKSLAVQSQPVRRLGNFPTTSSAGS